MTRAGAFRAGPALAAALAAGALFAFSPEPASASGLAALVGDYVEGRIAWRPEAGGGREPRPDVHRPPAGSPAAREAERAWLAGLEARLARIARATLSPGARRERDLLEARLAADRFALDVDRAWERDPGLVVRAAARLVAGGGPGPGADCGRLQETTRRLRPLPERLRAAMVDLREPEREAVARAIAECRALEQRHRAAFGMGRRDCRDARLQADFAEADTASLRALEAYRAHLEEAVLPRAEPRRPWGRERLAAWLATTQRETLSVERLAARAESTVASLRARLGGGAAPTTAPVADRPDEPRRRRSGGEAPISELRRLAADEALPDEPARRAWEIATSDAALGEPPADPVVARDLARLELGRARRLWAMLARHAGWRDSAATADWLVSEALAEPADAAREAAAAWDEPASALEALREWRVREARAEARERQGAAFDPAAFAREVRRVGALPSGLLREAILAALGLPEAGSVAGSR